jgi:hypothetical protein
MRPWSSVGFSNRCGTYSSTRATLIQPWQAKRDLGAMSCNLTDGKQHQVYAKALAYGPFVVCLIPSNAPIKLALEPVKLLKCIGEAGSDLGSRCAVQSICLN